MGDPSNPTSCLLLLHLIHEIKVSLVKVMYPHVSILTTARITSTLGIRCDGIQWSKMTFHPTNLILEYPVVKARFEFALPRRGSGHVHGGLTTSKDNKVFLGRDGCGVQGRIGDVGLQYFK